MNVAVLQPSYIPWRGYFHQILKSDIFIFYDDVQYDKHGWRNRNRIKTSNGTHWMTIPVLTAGVIENATPINQIKIDWHRNWNEKHWQMLKQSYGKTPYFALHEDWLCSFYSSHPTLLVDFTIDLTIAICKALNITSTKFIRSSELFNISGVKNERLINILKSIGATHYISGPSAQDYIDDSMFKDAGIELEYMVYDYPSYPQRYLPFDPNVSILDLMFMTGPDALKYIEHK
jgi:hypothetical protein